MPRTVRRRLADGTVKTYTYGPRRPPLYTVGDLIADYLRSPEWSKLKPGSQSVYRRALDHVRALSKVPVVDIRRRHVLDMRDALSKTPAIANQVICMWSILLEFALDRERVLHNAAVRVKTLPKGEFARWSEDQIAFALEAAPEWARRAIVLALYTGQRQSDLCRMTWSDYDGTGIRVVQQKTGEPLWIPVHRDLKAELTAWKAENRGLTILTQKRNDRPWKASSLSTMFQRFIAAHDELSGLVFHGLRKSAADRMAEAGCTAFEVAAITGHRSLSMVQHYTREASQRRRATAAVVKLEQAANARGKTKKTDTRK